MIVSVNLRKTFGWIDEQMIRRYENTWVIVTDNPTDGPLVVTDTTELPQLFSFYTNGATEYDLGATLRSLRPEPVDPPFIWEVIGEYSSERTAFRTPESPVASAGGTGGAAQRGSESERNPLLQLPDVQWESHKYQMPYEIDERGNATMNEALSPFDPRPVRDQTTRILRYTRNEATYDGSLAEDYEDHVNSVAFTFRERSFPAGSVRVESITASTQFTNDFAFWRVQYVLAFRRNRLTSTLQGRYSTEFYLPDVTGAVQVTTLDGWDEAILNAGFMKLDGVTGVSEPITVNDMAITEPVPLDLDGVPLVEDEIGASNPLIYLVFRPYARRSLGPLNIV